MNIETQWVVGFTDGEGNFHISINRNSSLTIGYEVLPEFTILQHVRSVKVLAALKRFFRAGVVRPNGGPASPVMAFRVRDFKQLNEIILPFFRKHELKTYKKIQFEKFCNVLEIMKGQEHLTPDGLAKIRKIRAELESLENQWALPTDKEFQDFNKDD